MRCHDKLESRRRQHEAVPNATPRFFALDPSDPIPDPLPLPFPLFVKPVSAHLSQLAFPVNDRQELEVALVSAREQLDRVAAFDEELEGRSFHMMLVEELLDGRLVTFEGFMHDGSMTPVGVTDSVMHPNGISFVRFDYPSALPPEVNDRLAEIAGVLMPALGFDDSLFNIEFFVAADGTAKIVEVNGRMASQFAPLVRAVHGTSTYRIQLELVTGGQPTLPSARRDVVASSFVLRRYVEDAVVEAVPDPAAVTDRFPGSQVEVLVRPGQRLSDNDDDSASHRLAVVAMSGPDRATLLRDWEEAQRCCRLAPTGGSVIHAPLRRHTLGGQLDGRGSLAEAHTGRTRPAERGGSGGGSGDGNEGDVHRRARAFREPGPSGARRRVDGAHAVYGVGRSRVGAPPGERDRLDGSPPRRTFGDRRRRQLERRPPR